jgi:hypothetical protein
VHARRSSSALYAKKSASPPTITEAETASVRLGPLWSTRASHQTQMADAATYDTLHENERGD